MAREQTVFEVFHQHVHRWHYPERQHCGHHQAAEDHGAQGLLTLGAVIFGGLVVATVLSLGVVPPFYVVVKALERRWFGAEESHAS